MGLWLDYRLRNGLVIDCAPPDTITPPDLEGFIRELVDRVRYETAGTYLVDMGEILRVMQVGTFKPAVKQVRAAARDLKRAAEPMPDVLTPTVGASELYEKAVARMTETLEESLTCWRMALAYCDALMIAIDVLTQIRLRTLSLTTRSHVRLKRGSYRLSYKPSEVKTRNYLLRTLPEELTAFVEHGFRVASFSRPESLLNPRACG